MAASLKNYDDYNRYLEIVGLPKGVHAFTENANGDIIIEFAERKCRMEIGGGKLCQVFTGTRGALVTHVKKQHQRNVDESDNEGKPKNSYVNSIKGMYSRWMRDHDVLVQQDIEQAQEAARLRQELSLPINTKFQVIVNARTGTYHLTKMSDLLRLQGKQVPCDSCMTDHKSKKNCHFDIMEDGEEGDDCANRRWFDFAAPSRKA